MGSLSKRGPEFSAASAALSGAWVSRIAMRARKALRSTAALSARLIVKDAPRKADVIVILPGLESRRLQQAVKLVKQGFAGQILFCASTRWHAFEHSEYDLAHEFLERQPAEVRQITKLLPVRGDSTATEGLYIENYLRTMGFRSAVLVTAEFHTRRSLYVYRSLFPGLQTSMSAVVDPSEFGVCWWQHRQWAKTLFNEIVRLAFWVAFDRYRFARLAERQPRHLGRRLSALLHRHS